MKTKFKEKQKFRQLWSEILLISILSLLCYGVITQVFLGGQFGGNPSSNFSLVLLALLVLVFIGIFWRIKLITKIDHENISIKYAPFINKDIKWSDVKEAKIVNHGSVSSGMRSGSKYGTLYNTSGKVGLAITLMDGTQICIGTQRGDELKEVIERIQGL